MTVPKGQPPGEQECFLARRVKVRSAHSLSLPPPQGVPGDLGAPGPSGARVSRASCRSCPDALRLALPPERPSRALSFPSRAREVSPVNAACKAPPAPQVPGELTAPLAMTVLR